MVSGEEEPEAAPRWGAGGAPLDVWGGLSVEAGPAMPVLPVGHTLPGSPTETEVWVHSVPQGGAHAHGFISTPRQQPVRVTCGEFPCAPHGPHTARRGRAAQKRRRLALWSPSPPHSHPRSRLPARGPHASQFGLEVLVVHVSPVLLVGPGGRPRPQGAGAEARAVGLSVLGRSRWEP